MHDAEMEIDEPGQAISPSVAVEPVRVKAFTLFGASRLDDYALEEKVGEGTFGVVHKARRKAGTVRAVPEGEVSARQKRQRARAGMMPAQSNVKEGEVVALKKIVMHNDMDGVPITALREIRILKSLNHPNVVPCIDMAYQQGEYRLVVFVRIFEHWLTRKITLRSGDYDSLRRGTVYMVFPYMAHDLAGLLENRKIDQLEAPLLKLYARQLLEGTSYLHLVRSQKRDAHDRTARVHADILPCCRTRSCTGI